MPVDAAHLLWAVSLGNVDWNPHPVGARTSTTPTSCASTSTRCRGRPGTTCGGSRWSADEVLREHGLVGFPRTSGSRGCTTVAIAPASGLPDRARGRARARARGRAPRRGDGDGDVVERGGPQEAVFVDYNQNAKDHTVAAGYSVRPVPDARVACHLGWDEVPDCEPATSASTPCPSGCARSATRARRSTRRPARSTRCSRSMAPSASGSHCHQGRSLQPSASRCAP